MYRLVISFVKKKNKIKCRSAPKKSARETENSFLYFKAENFAFLGHFRLYTFFSKNAKVFFSGLKKCFFRSLIEKNIKYHLLLLSTSTNTKRKRFVINNWKIIIKKKSTLEKIRESFFLGWKFFLLFVKVFFAKFVKKNQKTRKFMPKISRFFRHAKVCPKSNTYYALR